ncbi:hypothetical protein ACEZDB_35845 [Streptacidiphilus sp. N1-3]|uniref:Lsr2 DNA-binding domain-containing protein n=1 Tax=Streptacidiphilus alkalitolerans TaxID=3342712 RepID=A0ABV6XCK6_9ACTN
MDAVTKVAVDMHSDGKTPQEIEATTGLSPVQIAAAVEVASHPSPALTLAPAADDDAGSEILALLAWADKHPAAHIKQLGTRAHHALDAIRERRSNEAAADGLAREVAALEKQLKASRDRLRAARAGKPTGPADPTPADIRAWAKTAGVECGPYGQVPKTVRAAYDKAHGRRAA